MQCVRCANMGPGGLNSPRCLDRGPASTLRTQNCEIKYKKPTPGGGSKVCNVRLLGPVPLPFGDFFRPGEFQEASVPSSNNKRPQFQRHVGQAIAALEHLFLVACAAPARELGQPPGGQKVLRIFDRGRWANDAHLFAKLRNSFFERGVQTRKNRREIQGGGGSWWPTLR